MNKKYIVFILILIIAAGAAYYIISSKPKTSAGDLSGFEELKIGTPYSEVEKRFGKPEADIGSGIHIFVYTLPDKSQVLLGYAGLDSLIYVKHKLNDGTTVHLTQNP